jgi:hypothetical protein
MTTLLYCADPQAPGRPDPWFAAEAEAARAAGLDAALIAYEALVDGGDAEAAVRRVAPAADGPALGVYRGWMLRPGAYAGLYAALLARGVRLINDPAAYRHCHHLPEWYPRLEGRTPRSVWLETGPDVDLDAVMERLRPFGARPLIVKDFVTSRKHEWAEACFIPSAADRAAVARVVRRLVELQGPDLNEGLVFREFVALAPLGAHPRSGMPLAQEYRIFWLDGAPLAAAPYWDGDGYPTAGPPVARFRAAARAVPSRFFAMDVARTRAGGWTIVELGDGQVAGLPPRADPRAFYRVLAARPLTAAAGRAASARGRPAPGRAPR